MSLLGSFAVFSAVFALCIHGASVRPFRTIRNIFGGKFPYHHCCEKRRKKTNSHISFVFSSTNPTNSPNSTCDIYLSVWVWSLFCALLRALSVSNVVVLNTVGTVVGLFIGIATVSTKMCAVQRCSKKINFSAVRTYCENATKVIS